MKAFAAGTLALIALYALVQAGTGNKATEASNALTAGFNRLLNPTVAGLGNHAAAGGQAPASTSPSGATAKQSNLAVPGIRTSAV